MLKGCLAAQMTSGATIQYETASETVNLLTVEYVQCGYLSLFVLYIRLFVQTTGYVADLACACEYTRTIVRKHCTRIYHILFSRIDV